MKRIEQNVRRGLCLAVFFALLAFCFRPLYREKQAEKTGVICRIPVSIPRDGDDLCEGRYLRFVMPKRVQGEFDPSGHGFVRLVPGNGKDPLCRFGKVSAEKPDDATLYLRVVRFSRWWDDTIDAPFESFLLPRELTAGETEKLKVLSARRNWQLELKVKDGYASVTDLLVDGVPLWEKLHQSGDDNPAK